MQSSDEERELAAKEAERKAEALFDQPPASEEDVGIKSPLLNLGCALFLSVPFMLVGLGVLWLFTIGPVLQWSDAESWPASDCRIVTSGYHMKFSYTWETVDYSGESYDFSSFYAFTPDEAIARYEPGHAAKCFVNPDDPSEAILSKAFSGSYLDGLWGLIFLIAGLVMGIAFGLPAIKQMGMRR